MKILLTTDTWVPTINGVVTSTATLRAALTAQGHEVRVLTLSGDSHTYTKDGVTSLGSLDAGLVYPGARMRAPALNRAIRDLIDWHPDVVHSQCEFSTFAPARRIAHAAGAPLIHTYHTVYEDYTHYFSPSRSMGRKMAALFTRMICADCDAVIAPTPKISRLLAGYGVHCPVRIIPTGLDLQRFAVPRDDALHSRLGLPPKEANKTVLLSLGRLAKEKNTTELVDSMQNLPDAVLLIVGDGPERAVLEQQRAVTGAGESVFRLKSEAYYYKRWQVYCRVNDIPPVSAYEMRHTFVSVAKKLPAGEVKDLVGHSEDMDTFGVYGHALTGEDVQTAQAVNSMFLKLLHAGK